MTCIFHVVSIVSASVFAQASPQHRLAAGGGPHCDGEKYDATPLTAQIQAFHRDTSIITTTYTEADAAIVYDAPPPHNRRISHAELCAVR
jgi:hypothetical protein